MIYFFLDNPVSKLQVQNPKLIRIGKRWVFETFLNKLIVKRKPGHLYYVDGKGNICEAVMARGGRKKKSSKKKKR